MRGGSDGVEAIRPGHGAESELVRRVASRDPEERMPPEGEPLTPDQVATLRAWIDQGAKWPDDPSGASGKARGHWAFRPPVRPAVPPVRAGGLGAQPDRPLHPRPARGGGAVALARGRPGHPPPPAQPRPDRPAADARGGGRLPRRHERRTPTSRPSTACWPRRTTASAGAGTGSTPPATPTPTATRRTSRATSGSTATGSSTPSTATCPTTSSSSSRSPATCCRTPRRTRSSPPASCATR